MNILARDGGTEVVQVELRAGIDGQGKPGYDSPIDVDARVIIHSEVIRQPSGSEQRVIATVWIDGAQSTLPTMDDRIATAQGLVGIVVDRLDGRSLSGVLDHVRLKIREE